MRIRRHDVTGDTENTCCTIQDRARETRFGESFPIYRMQFKDISLSERSGYDVQHITVHCSSMSIRGMQKVEVEIDEELKYKVKIRVINVNQARISMSRIRDSRYHLDLDRSSDTRKTDPSRLGRVSYERTGST